MDLAELIEAEEIFITSTTMEIIPVINLNGNSISNEKPGTVTKILYTEYQRLIKAFNS